MISRIWWINFLLSAASLVVIILAINVLRQNPAIPSAVNNASEKWPEISGVVTGRKMNESDYKVVTEKNPFSAERVFTDSEKEDNEVKAVKITNEPKEIEEGSLDLFATFSGDSISYAIVSNPGIPEITKPQIRVKNGDKLGDYLIEKIEPNKIIVKKNNESFEVKLKKTKSVDKKFAPKKEGSPSVSSQDEKRANAKKVKNSSDDTASKKVKSISETPSKEDKGGSKTTDKTTTIAPKETAPGSQTNPDNPQKSDTTGKNLVTEGGETYEIMKTPFGTVKRKVK